MTCSDALRQLRPVFGNPPHGQHRVDPTSITFYKVLFQRLSTPPRKPVVEGITALWRRCSRQRDGIYIKLLLLDDLPHQIGNLVQLPPVVAQRIYHARIAYEELNGVAILNWHILVDHLDPISRHGIDEGEHRRYDVTQRIGRRQTVGAVIHGQDLPLKRNEHLFRGFIGLHLL